MLQKQITITKRVKGTEKQKSFKKGQHGARVLLQIEFAFFGVRLNLFNAMIFRESVMARRKF